MAEIPYDSNDPVSHRQCYEDCGQMQNRLPVYSDQPATYEIESNWNSVTDPNWFCWVPLKSRHLMLASFRLWSGDPIVALSVLLLFQTTNRFSFQVFATCYKATLHWLLLSEREAKSWIEIAAFQWRAIPILLVSEFSIRFNLFQEYNSLDLIGIWLSDAYKSCGKLEKLPDNNSLVDARKTIDLTNSALSAQLIQLL